MNRQHYTFVILFLFLLLPVMLFGQELRLAPYTVSNQYLNQQIAADTAANGKLANRVYVLQRGGLYLSNAVFTNTGNWTLRLKANDSSTTKKPVIMLFPTGAGTTPWNPPGNLFQLNGSLIMKNLQVSGYYELVDSNRWNMQGALINIPSTQSGLSITIDSCILSNSNGNHIRTDGASKAIKITNSVFANMGYLGRSNLGAGKAIDLRDVSCDSLIMTNNTFVNWLDRIVRHYPAGSATSTKPLEYFVFDHNTLVNGMSYHGILSLGTVGWKTYITNNLFIDPFGLGEDVDSIRQAEFIPSGEKDAVGRSRMTWIFTYPNTTTSWIISNNYYAISDSGQAFYNQFASAGVKGEGSPLTWHLNGRLGADSAKAFTKVSLQLNKIPKLMAQLMRWYRDPSGGKKSKNTPGAWTYGTATDPNDFDRKGYAWLRDSLNCAYPTAAAVYTAGTGAYPVGDLNWFPTKLAAWLANPPSAVEQVNTVPTSFALEQNFPNPFNPSTRIAYSIMKNSQVKLEVFDLLGRQVATLVNESQKPGEYAVSFDGSGLTSGFYIYKLSTAEQTVSKKMMLIK
ncbi:MAG: T9SS type A sorting domain-containing protein [bacterium]